MLWEIRLEIKPFLQEYGKAYSETTIMLNVDEEGIEKLIKLINKFSPDFEVYIGKCTEGGNE